MNEYIERKAVFKIVADIMCDCKVRHKGRAINRNIKQLPVADVVPVVRCKDCKHFHVGVDLWDNITLFCNRTPFNMATSHNDFCNYGERKEGASNG